MVASSRRRDTKRVSSIFSRVLVPALAIGSLLQGVTAEDFPNIKDKWRTQFIRHNKRDTPAKRGPPEDWQGKVPLVVTNRCDSTIWPGVVTQSGTGPGTGGFELAQGDSKKLWVGADWQGRVWGRTNCTVDGDSASCKTGDCFSKLDCEFSVGAPGRKCLWY